MEPIRVKVWLINKDARHKYPNSWFLGNIVQFVGVPGSENQSGYVKAIILADDGNLSERNVENCQHVFTSVSYDGGIPQPVEVR